MNFYFGREEEGERWMAHVEELAKTSYVSPIGYTVVEVVRRNTD